MNLKTKLLGFAAAIAICLGIAAPAAAVGPSATAGTNLTVNFADVGGFSVGLSGAGFGGGLVTASTAAQTLNGSLTLTYNDTNAYRGGFHVDLSATDFNSTLTVPYSSPAVVYAIPATGLKLTKNYNPQQQRWTSQGCTAGFPSAGCLWAYRVGDIGATDQSGTSIGNTASATWTANNNLNVARKVAQGWAGSGTVLTTQAMDITLDVPAAMPGAIYTSTVTATVVGETP